MERGRMLSTVGKLYYINSEKFCVFEFDGIWNNNTCYFNDGSTSANLQEICKKSGGDWINNVCLAGGSGRTTILQPGESAVYFITIANGNGLKTKDWFSLEVKPQNGASTLISRAIISGLSTGDVL